MNEAPETSGEHELKTSAPAGIDREHTGGFKEDLLGEESVDRKLADIELAGEEVAAGWKPYPHTPLSPEVRYLHISRTINQLVTDRNRSVGIFLGMASILFAASTALLNVKPEVVPIIPLGSPQYWCLPATFGTLSILAIFISFLLIRSRIGLIYEVTKMNAILGLHSKRVERVNPLSIFYLMHLLVVVLGGASAGFTAGMLAFAAKVRSGETCLMIAVLTTILFIAALQALYYITILRNTSDTKLDLAEMIQTGVETSVSDHRYICVFCGSSMGTRPEHADAAWRVGSALARMGFGLVYGGGRVGLMGQVADAALAGGAQVIGVIPERLATKELAHDGLTELHIVTSMHERKALMAERASAFLTLPGGIGTFEEFFEILTWAALGYHNKPLGLLNVGGYFDPMLAMLNHGVDEGFIRPSHLDLIVVSAHPKSLVGDLSNRLRTSHPKQDIDLETT